MLRYVGPSIALFLWSLLTLGLSACASGRTGGNNGTDAGPSGPDDGGTRLDTGSRTCPAGQHLCGAGCIDDLANLPENGCRNGCGEACPTPSNGVAGCGENGECKFVCEPPFAEVGGACACVPQTCEDLGYACGAPDDGCGTPLDCGTCDGDAACMEGVCACAEDAQEPNDSRLEITGRLYDIPNQNWSAEYSEFSIHDETDTDWFSWHVSDSGRNNPRIRIYLQDIPEGSNYDLSAYYVCTEGSEQSSCDDGEVDNMVGHGCASSNAGNDDETIQIHADCGRGLNSDDSGMLYVRVIAREWGGSCAPYTLVLDVTN